MNEIAINITKAHDSLLSLREKVSSENYSISKHLFKGADINILPKYHEYVNKKTQWLHNDMRIVTPYPFELSWLIFQIKYIFYEYGLINAHSKYFVFRNLGNAALDYHSNNGDGDVIDLLLCVLDESQTSIVNLLSKKIFALA